MDRTSSDASATLSEDSQQHISLPQKLFRVLDRRLLGFRQQGRSMNKVTFRNTTKQAVLFFLSEEEGVIVRDRKNTTNQRHQVSGDHAAGGFQGVTWRRSVSCNDTEAAKVEETELQPQKFALSGGMAVTVSLSASRLTYMKALTEDVTGNWTMLHFERTIDSNTTTSFEFQTKHLRHIISRVQGTQDNSTAPNARNVEALVPGHGLTAGRTSETKPNTPRHQTDASRTCTTVDSSTNTSQSGLSPSSSETYDELTDDGGGLSSDSSAMQIANLSQKMRDAANHGEFYIAQFLSDKADLERKLSSLPLNLFDVACCKGGSSPRHQDDGSSLNLESELEEIYEAKLKVKLSCAVAEQDFHRAAQLHALLTFRSSHHQHTRYSQENSHESLSSTSDSFLLSKDNAIKSDSYFCDNRYGGCSTTDDDDDDDDDDDNNEDGEKIEVEEKKDEKHHKIVPTMGWRRRANCGELVLGSTLETVAAVSGRHAVARTENSSSPTPSTARKRQKVLRRFAEAPTN